MDAPSPSEDLPRVTVVIPCYNYGRYLVQCVHSVLAQKGVAVDALIVNDASTDDSAEVACGLADADARVSVIDHQRNIGHIASYNEGLGSATGDYVVLLSADDMLTPGSLARATTVMEARPHVGLVYGHPLVIHDDDVIPARTGGLRGVHVWAGADWISAQCRRGLSCIYCPEVCVRTSVQRTVGDYSATLPHTADLEMWLRVASVAHIARVSSDQAYRRMHGESMMQTTFGGLLADLQGRRDAYESFFGGAGAELPRAKADLATARRRLAGEALEHACIQLRSTDRTSPGIDGFVTFAAELQGAEVSRMWQWHEYQLLPAHADRSPAVRTLNLRYSAARRDLEGRHRWWRWRLTGV
jgi:hypothetical protein